MSDFPDWLSPIIVKELRQGLRSKAFVLSFFMLQGAMIVTVLLALVASRTPLRIDPTFLFWAFAGGFPLLAIPFRGVKAISGEVEGNTLELLLLTQLSAWRITVGKWAALFLQSLLLLTTLLPYVVLRYFLGGVDLTGELMGLAAMVAGGAILTACAVRISSVVRPQLIFFLFLLSLIIFGGAISDTFFWRAPARELWFFATMLTVLSPLAVLLVLETSVWKIAPLGENSVWRKRLLVMGIVFLSTVIASAFNAWELVGVVAVVLVIPSCLGALLERTLLIPSLYQPFPSLKNWPRLSRIASLLLQPSFASGLLFTAVVIGAMLSFLSWRNSWVIISVIVAVFSPVALIRNFPVYSTWRIYFGVQLLGIAFMIFLSLVFPNWLVLCGLHPLASFLILLRGDLGQGELAFMRLFAAIFFFVTMASFIRAAFSERKRIAAICASFTPPAA